MKKARDLTQKRRIASIAAIVALGLGRGYCPSAGRGESFVLVKPAQNVRGNLVKHKVGRAPDIFLTYLWDELHLLS